MAHNASRRGAANLGTPLMIVAMLVIGGFLYWLWLQAEAERELERQELQAAADSAAALAAMGDFISGSAIQTDPTPYMGRTVTLEDQTVTGTLGTQGVWIELPNQNPFLVSFSEAVKAEGVSLTSGQMATITGQIHAMSDSTLTAWTDAGSINDNDRLAAEFATHYLEAEQVRPGGMAPPDEEEGDTGGP